MKLKIFFLFLALILFSHVVAYDANIVEPNVAGDFYPNDSKQLSEMIDGYLNEASPKAIEGDIFALISPHAGYGFSGQTAAYGYKLIKLRPYKTVIVIAPSHHYSFNGASVYLDGIFRTPLGDLEVDKDFTQQLLNKNEQIVFNPDVFSREHSLEVQLPFLQETLKDFKIVPIIMGDNTLETCQQLARLLKKAIAGRRDILVVCSTDLYHGYDYDELDKTDNLTIDYLNKMDDVGLYYALREGRVQMCGGFAVVVALKLAKEMGHNKLLVLNHTDSGKVTGNRQKGIWTVGYLSAVIDSQEGEAQMFNANQKRRLLEIARSSIKEYLKTGKRMDLEENDPALKNELGAFVTLHKNGDLRGCIGNLIGNKPLYITIRDMAISAAVDDWRFEKLSQDELNDIEIEISVLSPLKRISSPEEIIMGKHGVLVKKGVSSGVFLPQVATETGWSKEEFLNNLCTHKAGISAEAWKDKSTELYIFSAEVFSEKELSEQ